MFIYETRKIFASDHTGPFKGIITCSEKDTPAAIGDKVVFVKSAENEVLVIDEFPIGSEE